VIGITFHPFAYVAFVFVFLFCWVVIRSKTDVHGLIGSINSLGDQWTALIVICVGCVMLLLAKQYGIDNTVAGGIVGAGLGILTKKNVPAAPEEKPFQLPPPVIASDVKEPTKES